MHSVPAHTYTRIYVCMYYVGISDIIIIIRCRPRLKHPKYVPNNYNNNDAKYHYEELTIASLTGSLTWFYWPFCNKHKLRTPDSLTTDQSVLNTSWVPLIYWPLISLYWIQIENLWFTDHWPVCTVHKLRTSDTLTTYQYVLNTSWEPLMCWPIPQLNCAPDISLAVSIMKIVRIDTGTWWACMYDEQKMHQCFIRTIRKGNEYAQSRL